MPAILGRSAQAPVELPCAQASGRRGPSALCGNAVWQVEGRTLRPHLPKSHLPVLAPPTMTMMFSPAGNGLQFIPKGKFVAL